MKALLFVRKLFMPLICLAALASCAQSDSLTRSKTQRYYYKLGTTGVTLRKTTFDSSGAWFFIRLHDDEVTAEAAALHFLEQHGGTLLTIENKNNRFIRFAVNGRKYQFDPNRMFTKAGIRSNLQLLNSKFAAAQQHVERFGNFVLRLVPDTALVIAVHNNTEGRYSIRSYTSDPVLKRNAAAVHINPAHDSDDFFITTDDALFKKLREANYNCVLQNNETATDDGSLSIYYDRQGRRYINVEAQAGHLAQQKEMIHALEEALQAASE
jgi:hypothetical protein